MTITRAKRLARLWAREVSDMESVAVAIVAVAAVAWVFVAVQLFA
jgi:hypothetical protein